MEIAHWMDGYTAAVRQTFGARVRCVGLQGSQARGEAREGSDIDVVLLLDEWGADDWARYDALLADLSERNKVCGFVSGWQELLCWEPSELFGFYYDTQPWYGDLQALKTRFGPADARRAAHTGACGIYHACAHNRLHEKDAAALRELCKSAFFVLRAVYFCRTGVFTRRRADLLPQLTEEERAILAGDGDFDAQSERLLRWASGLIRNGI